MSASSTPLVIRPLATAEGQRALDRLLRRGELVLDQRTRDGAREIVEAVRTGGDAALLEAVKKFDGVAVEGLTDLRLRPGAEEGEGEGWEAVPAAFRDALDRAIDAVERFHRPQVTPGYTTERGGVTLEEHRRPLRRVGIYVPGGRAGYPSTAVMTAVPARLAGVEEIVVVTPAPAYRRIPALRYALDRLGITEVWGMGGAHGIAALAYGTATIPRVDKIVGPGNAWVTAAKQLVSPDVAIDGLAGPSEVVIVAAGDADPRWVAADLLAQAEHDPLAAAVLLTDNPPFAQAVAAAVAEQLETLPTAETARASLERFGGVFLVADGAEALATVEALAPEHLQLVGAWPEALAPRVRNAGAIFLGAATPEVFGDYIAGPSHVLPTCGNARFASALGVEDFVRRSHTARFTPQAAAEWAGAAAALADVEGLPGHAAAARWRSPSPQTPLPRGEGLSDLPLSPWERGTEGVRGLVRPELRALSLYHLDQTPFVHKLDQNEVPWDLPRRLKVRVARQLVEQRWAQYPDFHADALRSALGRLHDWPMEGVLAGNGSGELVAVALDTFAAPAGEVLGTVPSFSLYKMLTLKAHNQPRFLGPTADLQLPMAALVAEVERDPRRPVLLCTPNNPTGDAATVAQVEGLLERLEAPLLLDNAYGEFCRHDYRPLLRRHRHLVLFRTLSKAWSLAGMRLGYLLADPEVAQELIKIKLPYNLNHASVLAGLTLLAEPGFSARPVGAILARRTQWAALLAKAGLEVFPSEANFLLVRCPDGAGAGDPEAAARLWHGLAERGILVRDVGSYPGLAGCLRISVGSGAALRATERALTDMEFFKEATS
jgi:histidinol dehydrogenase